MEDFEAEGCHFLLMLKSPHFLFRDVLIQFFFSPIPVPSNALPRRERASVISANAPKTTYIHMFL